MRDWKSEIRGAMNSSRLEGSSEAELIEELAGHAEERYLELQRGGESEDEAFRHVQGELRHMEQATRARQWQSSPRGQADRGIAPDFWRDVRYGLRGMRRAPLFTFFTVLTLALGIGANTTVFTVINSLLLHPLPVDDLSQLAVLYKTQAKTTGRSANHLPISYADFRDYEKQQNSFSTLAAYQGPQVLSLRTSNGQVRAFGEFVSGRYFDTLGLRPALGRFFQPSEVQAAGSVPVAVASYNAWQARFQGGNAIGRTIVLNGVALTIVGVAPKNFLGVDVFFGPDFWIPATMGERILPMQMKAALTDRNKDQFQVIGRLRPGVTLANARSAMEALSIAVNREYGEPADAAHLSLRSLPEELSQAGGSGGFAMGSAVLLVIVGLVLAIACANVANLQLARGAARSGEIAVRLAMGARRGRLVRQLLTECLLLSFAGCALGFLIGYGGCRLLWSFLPADVSINLVSPKLDPVVWVFTVVISLGTVLLFGLVPSMRAARVDVVQSLKQSGRSGGRTRRARLFTRILLVGQVAFSLVCLTTAVLVYRSVQRAYTINPGFNTGSLSVYMMNPEQSGYDNARVAEFYRVIHDRLAADPAIAATSWASGMPFWNSASQSVRINGIGTQAKSALIPAVNKTADVDYFSTMQIVIDRGRAFNTRDTESSGPVAIVNAQFAKEHWPGGDALGKQLTLAGETTPRQVVGIARTSVYGTLGEAPQNCVYVPLKQKFAGGMTLHVRAKGPAGAVIEDVQRKIRDYDPAIPVTDARTGTKLMDDALFAPRMGVGLLGIFGSLALLLASAGLYGVMAYSVSQREKEIGVRLALGASSRSIIATILREGFVPVIWGLAMGLASFVALSRVLSRILFGIGSLDVVSVASGVLSMLAIAFFACYLPARTATQVDPTSALRDV